MNRYHRVTFYPFIHGTVLARCTCGRTAINTSRVRCWRMLRRQHRSATAHLKEARHV